MKDVLPRPVERARRELAAARALYTAGLVPECHAAMVRALRALLDAWQLANVAAEPSPAEPSPAEPSPAEPSPAEPSPAEDERSADERALVALSQAGYRRVERLRTALAACAPIALERQSPSEAVTPGELPDDFETIWAETERLASFTTRRRLLPRARKRIRIALALVLGATLLAAMLITLRVWYRPRAIASAVLSWEFPAAHAVDGLQATEWLLPDKTTGWLDVVFPSPRDIQKVTILNVHNRYFADRASKRVRVTAFDEFSTLGSVEGQYDRIVPKRSPLDLRLRVKGATRLRVEVLSSFDRGGGIAEVEVR
jgi:hypothetical protein